MLLKGLENLKYLTAYTVILSLVAPFSSLGQLSASSSSTNLASLPFPSLVSQKIVEEKTKSASTKVSSAAPSKNSKGLFSKKAAAQKKKQASNQRSSRTKEIPEGMSQQLLSFGQDIEPALIGTLIASINSKYKTKVLSFFKAPSTYKVKLIKGLTLEQLKEEASKIYQALIRDEIRKLEKKLYEINKQREEELNKNLQDRESQIEIELQREGQDAESEEQNQNGLQETTPQKTYKEDEILVTFKDGIDQDTINNIVARESSQIIERLTSGAFRLKILGSTSAQELVSAFKGFEEVENASLIEVESAPVVQEQSSQTEEAKEAEEDIKLKVQPKNANRTKEQIEAKLGEFKKKLANKDILTLLKEEGAEEIVEERTPTAKHFDTKDGIRSAVIYPSAIHFKDKDGSFTEIDNSLNYNQEKGVYQNKANSYQVELEEKRAAFSLTKDNNRLSLSYIPFEEKELEAKEATSPLLKNNTLLFSDIEKDVDIKFSLTSKAIEKEIIIKKRGEKNTFSFNLGLEGLRAEKAVDGALVFKDRETKEEIFVLSAPFVYDAASKPKATPLESLPNKEAVRMDAIEEDGQTLLVFEVDKAYLDDPKRVYPIVIDPASFEANYLDIDDSWISSAFPDTNYNTFGYNSAYELYYNDYLAAGKSPDFGETYSLIKFAGNDLAFFKGKELISANLWLYCLYSQTDTPTSFAPDGRTQVWLNTIAEQDWDPNTVTWRNQPFSRSHTDDPWQKVKTDDHFSFNVINPIRNWANGVAGWENPNNNGFLLHEDGNGSELFKLFLSNEGANKITLNSALAPHLGIFYYNTPPTTTMLTPLKDEQLKTEKPTFSWTYNDIDNDPQIAYEIQVATHPSFLDKAILFSKVDGPGTYFMLQTPLVEGRYFARVRVVDAYGEYSNWADTTFLISGDYNAQISANFSTLPADTTLTIPLSVKNTGKKTWASGGDNPTYLEHSFYTSAGERLLIFGDVSLTSLPYSLPANQTIYLKVPVKTPVVGGNYTLKFNMRGPSFSFEDKGVASLVKPVTIEENIGVSYLGRAPPTTAVNQTLTVPITVTNKSYSTLNATGTNPFYLSYRIIDQFGDTFVSHGARTNLPSDIGPFQRITVNTTLWAPALEGVYTYQIELMQENVGWLSAKGVESLDLTVAVEPLGANSFWPMAEGTNLFSGNLVLSATDATIAGRSPAPSLLRTYNSLSTKTGLLGKSWVSNFETKLSFSGDYVRWHTSEGGVVIFKKNTDGTYKSPAGVYTTLTKNPDLTYTLEEAKKIKLNFSENGRLLNIADKDNNTTSFNYDLSSRVTSIVDASGRALNLAYNASGYLASLSLPDATSIGYSYTNSYLTKATFDATGLNLTTSYAYDVGGRLTSITNAASEVTSISYDASGKVEKIIEPRTYQGSQIATTFAYDEANRITTVTDANNVPVMYTFNPNFNPYSLTLPATAEHPATTTYSYYDLENNLIATKSPTSETILEYDNAKKPITKGVLTATTSVDRTTFIASTSFVGYDENYNPVVGKDEKGNKTRLIYDDKSNLINVVDSLSAVSSFAYDTYGNLTSKTEAISPASSTPLNSFIKTWLINGVHKNPDQTTPLLNKDYLSDEPNVSPLEDSFSGNKSWNRHISSTDYIDLAKVYSTADRGVEKAAAYAFTYIYSPYKTTAQLWLGSDDGIKVFLNGSNIFTNNVLSAVDQNKIGINLKAGYNRLLIKVNQETGPFGFWARIVDAAGNYIAGLHSSIGPTFEEANPVLNASAEFDTNSDNHPDDWTWSWGNPSTSAAYDSEQAINGTRSLRQSHRTSTGDSVWHTDTPLGSITPGGEYTFSAFVKTEGLFENFSDNDLSTFEPVFGNFKVEDGELSQSDINLSRTFIQAGSSFFEDFTFSTKVMFLSENEEGELLFRIQPESGAHYEISLRGREFNDLSFYKAETDVGGFTPIAKAPLPFLIEQGVFYEVKAEMVGSSFKFYVNGALVLQAQDTTYTRGRIGFSTFKSHVHFDNVKVEPIAGSGGARLWIAWSKDRANFSNYGYSDFVQTTGEWQLITITAKAPADVNSVRIHLEHKDFFGSSWFDSVKVSERISTTFDYDKGGNYPIRVVDEAGAVGQSSYDGLGRLLTTSTVDESLAAFFHFDEDSASVAKDATSNANNGQIYGAETDTSIFNKALRFNGVNNYVNVPLNLSSQEMTGEAWVYFAPPTDPAKIKEGILTSYGYAFHMWANPDASFNFGAWTTHTNEEYRSNKTYSFNSWHHVAVVNKGGAYTRLYVDGVLDREMPLTGNLGAITYFDIGRHPGSGLYYFEGLIDEVKIYGRALDETEIQTTYFSSNKERTSTYTYDKAGRVLKVSAPFTYLDEGRPSSWLQTSVEDFRAGVGQGADTTSSGDIKLAAITQGATNPSFSAFSSWNTGDIGSNAAPALGDLDNDGDLDLLIGEYYGVAKAYKNTGSVSAPLWTLQSSWNSADVGYYASPALGDLDNDSDLDLLLGSSAGTTIAYKNTGSVSAPLWSAFSAWNIGDIGSNAAPFLADLDNDGDLDLLIGNSVGTTLAYKNTGSLTSPAWSAYPSWNVSDIGSYSSPALGDLDNDGDFDLLIGENYGVAFAYKNTGSVTSPVWSAQSSWNSGDVGYRAKPALADLDKDGDLDLLVGNSVGLSYAYKNTAPSSASYVASATFISSTFDTKTPSNFNSISFLASTPALTSVKFQIATNKDNLTWGFVGPDGTSATYYQTPGEVINPIHKKDRYLKYKAYLQTSNPSQSPTLSEVSISYQSLIQSSTVAYEYDKVGRVVKIVDAKEGIGTSTYLPGGLVDTQTNATGVVTRYEYDKVSNPTKAIADYGVGRLNQTTTFTYDERGRRKSTTDAALNTTTFFYDENSNLVKDIDPKGYVTTFTYDGLGRRISTTDAKGYVSNTVYDAGSNIIGQTDTFNPTSAPADSFNVATLSSGASASGISGEGFEKLIDSDTTTYAETLWQANPNYMQVTLDKTYALSSIKFLLFNADARVFTYRVETSIDGVNFKVVKDASSGSYSGWQEVRFAVKPEAVKYIRIIGLSSNANDYFVVSEVEAWVGAATSTAAYDSEDGLISSVDAKGYEVKNFYDARGNLSFYLDAKTNITSFLYDRAGRNSKVFDSIGASSTTYYDAYSNVVRVVDALYKSNYFTYDNLARLRSTTNAIGHKQEFYYDIAGNPTRVVSKRLTSSASLDMNITTRQSFDALNRPLEAIDAAGFKTSQIYDALGRVTQTFSKNANYYNPTHSLSNPYQPTKYIYTLNNLLDTTVDPLGVALKNTYDKNNNLVSTTFDPAGLNQKSTFSYDELDRLVSVTDERGNAAQTAFFSGLSEAGTGGWARRRKVSVTEPSVFSRVNAPLRVNLTFEAGIVASALREIRVVEGALVDAAKEVPHKVTDEVISGGFVTSATVTFLVNMAKGESKDYYIYYANPQAAAKNYTIFKDNTSASSSASVTEYYSRQDLAAGLDAYTLTNRFSVGDSATTLKSLPFAFKYFGVDKSGFWVTSDGFASGTQTIDYTNTSLDFRSKYSGMIAPAWDDFWTDRGPANAGVYENVYSDRVVYTWRASNYSHPTEHFIFQAVLYKSGDIMLRYDSLNLANSDINTNQTAGISKGNNTSYLTNTLVNGTNTTPTYFYQYAEAYSLALGTEEVPLSTPSGNFTTAYTYDERGRKATMADSKGTTTYKYDDNDRLIQTINPIGQSTYFVYDKEGMLLSASNAASAITYTYDANNRLTQEIDTKAATSVEYAYDLKGRVTSIGYRRNNLLLGAESFSYDADDRLNLLNRDLSLSLNNYQYTYAYDSHDNLTSVSSSPNAAISTLNYVYNERDELVTIKDASNSTIVSYAYDADGNIVQEINFKAGTTSSFTYDGANQLKELKTYTTANPTSVIEHLVYTYDKASNITKIEALPSLLNKAAVTTPSIDDTNLVAAYSFDEGAGAVAYDKSGNNNATLTPGTTWASARYATGLSFDSDINANGNSVGEPSERAEAPHSASLNIGGTSLTLAGWIKLGATGEGHSLVCKWDSFDLRIETNLITGVIWALSPTNHFSVPVSLNRGQWYHIAFTYDGSTLKIYVDSVLVGSVASSGNVGTNTNNLWIGANQGGGQVTGSVDEVRVYNKALTATEVRNLYTYNTPKEPITTFDYDEASELLNDGVYSYTYDENGNRLTKKDIASGLGVSYTYNNANQLIQSTDTRLSPLASVNYTYDASGNTTADGKFTYTYDSKGRLIIVRNKITSAVVATYTYDANGKRMSKTQGSNTTYFVYSEVNEMLLAEYNESGKLLRSYTTATDDYGELVSVTFNEPTTNIQKTYYYLLNGQGDVVALLDTNRNVMASWTYDSFGLPTEYNASGLKVAVGSAQNPYLYRGYYYDFETGLYYLDARYYNPDTARFLTVDPDPGVKTDRLSQNPYIYTTNNPVNEDDPNGHGPVSNFINGIIKGAVKVGRYIGRGFNSVVGGIGGLIRGARTGYKRGGIIGAVLGAIHGHTAGMIRGAKQGIKSGGIKGIISSAKAAYRSGSKAGAKAGSRAAKIAVKVTKFANTQAKKFERSFNSVTGGKAISKATKLDRGLNWFKKNVGPPLEAAAPYIIEGFNVASMAGGPPGGILSAGGTKILSLPGELGTTLRKEATVAELAQLTRKYQMEFGQQVYEIPKPIYLLYSGTDKNLRLTDPKKYYDWGYENLVKYQKTRLNSKVIREYMKYEGIPPHTAQEIIKMPSGRDWDTGQLWRLRGDVQYFEELKKAGSPITYAELIIVDIDKFNVGEGPVYSITRYTDRLYWSFP